MKGPLPIVILACAGCVSTQTLREDAESVFREHNRVASEVMFVLPELDPEAPATLKLIAADHAMMAACAPLNEIAVARRDARRIGLRQRLRVPATIDACRARTAAARASLAGLD